MTRSAILISSSANAFWGSDLSIEKERTPIAPEWVKKNDDTVMRKVFAVDKSDLPAVKNYIAEIKSLFKLKYIDFDTISTLDPTQLKLSHESQVASSVKNQYVKLVDSVKAIVDVKLQARQQAVIDRETLSKNYAMEIANFEERQQGYRTAVQAVYDLKEETIKAKALSEQAVKDLSATLVAQLNQHSAMPKPLKNNYFERPKMKSGHCEEAIISKDTFVQFGYEVQGFCFTSKFRIENKSADSLLNDTQMMSALESKITAIAQEKIKQGDSDRKEGGKPGYKQQIAAFSRGGIEDVKKAAKAQYGNTDKGFSFKIKALNKKLASNNRKIVKQKQNVLHVPAKELKHSQELKALKPLSDEDIVNLSNRAE